MGHVRNPDKEYHLLNKRLDQTVTGAPHSPTFIKILKLVFSEDEARLARQLPLMLKPLSKVAREIGMPLDELDGHITDMAQRGLVLDMEFGGKRQIMLAPVVIGFFEYLFMRVRDQLPMKELAELFEQYMLNEGEFAHSVFAGQTQLGRSLVREEALPTDTYTEILDWERATWIIETATDHGVALCACRHHNEHLGKACEAPQRTCLTLNYGVEPLVKAGITERITKREAMGILEMCKEAGLCQTGDNVKNRLTYICNCCGCCCGMMQAIKTFNLHNAIVTSNWITAIDSERCKGCGLCAKACPVDAIEIKERPNGRPKRWAERNAGICLGCGVCVSSCKFGALTLVPREARVYTPESVFDKTIMMAIERGKLSSLLFDNPDKLSHRALARVIAVLEKSPPYQAAMAIKPLRSAFFNTLLKSAKSKARGQTTA